MAKINAFILGALLAISLASAATVAPSVSVPSALGVGKYKAEYSVDTTTLNVRNNIGSNIVVRGIAVNNYADRLWYGKTVYDEYSRPQMEPYFCGSNSDCAIPVYSGQTVKIQARSVNVCTIHSVNSVVPSAQIQVKVYYTDNTREPVKTQTISMTAQCHDYWLCRTDSDCQSRYSDPSMNCWNGGCFAH